MFSQEVIKAVATTLNDRFYSCNLGALSAFSNLLNRKRNGSHFLAEHELSALLHTQIEKSFPVPYMHMSISAKDRTVSIDGHVFVVPEKKDGEGSLFAHWNNNPWNIVISNATGGYELVASDDQYAIPHGEYSTPYDMNAALNQPSIYRVGNVVVVSGTVVWIIDSWEAVGKVLAHCGGRLPFEIAREMYFGREPLDLVTEEEMANTYLNQDTTDELGLENRPVPFTVLEVVQLLVTAQKELEASKPAPAPTKTKEELELEKIMKDINTTTIFQDLLTEVKALPVKKRTLKSLNNLIPMYLKKIQVAIEAKK